MTVCVSTLSSEEMELREALLQERHRIAESLDCSPSPAEEIGLRGALAAVEQRLALLDPDERRQLARERAINDLSAYWDREGSTFDPESPSPYVLLAYAPEEGNDGRWAYGFDDEAVALSTAADIVREGEMPEAIVRFLDDGSVEKREVSIDVSVSADADPSPLLTLIYV